ncbi:MAG: hypothetical protein HGA84_00680 [Syntrophobacteraceae bacterium]|nr:hypothetical protein [Syntrophobacteraceae bacterium]
MKVDNVERQQNIQPCANKSKGNNPSDGFQFLDLLQNEMETGSVATAELSQAPELGSSKLEEALLYSTFPESAVSSQARESLEAGIGEMEMLVKALGDEGVSPKMVDEIVQRLPGTVEGMQGNLTDLQADHPLRLIADELSVLSYVESVKWRRGDYV